MMGHWNLNVGTMGARTGPDHPFRATGSGLHLSDAVGDDVSCVPKERMGYAASLYNMMRNTGSAIGI